MVDSMKQVEDGESHHQLMELQAGITNGLDVLRIGAGSPVILVHGTGGSREETWSDQLSLADKFSLVLPDRRGYGESDPAVAPDFERDGADIASLLDGGAHLVGFSYGGIGSLLAAAKRPDAVLSLTLIEPIVFGLVPGQHSVDDLVSRLRAVYDAASELTPEEFDARFDRALGFEASATEVDEVTRGRLDAARRERPPWEARPDLRPIAKAGFPKLVISGAWHPAFDATCDFVQHGIGAQRVVLPGGHGAQHRAGANQHLVSLWTGHRPSDNR
jgi:pimeloyl-ACP methyl ester carboxylesterase